MGLDRIMRSVFSRRKGLSSGASRPPWTKFARKAGLIGALVLAAGSLFGGYVHWQGQAVTKPAAPMQAAKSPVEPAKPAATVPVRASTKREPLKPGTRYVRRNNSVLRVAAKASAKALARKAKGDA